MRFKTEQEGLQHIKEKMILDPKSWSQREKKCMKHVAIWDDESAKSMFEDWLWLKRFMFSPEESIALRGEDHRGRKGKINQALRDHHINTFVDWAEERPRRRAIIVVDANQKNAATQIVEQVDIIGGEQTFAGLGLSANGKEPASHLWCSWNCSASEYEFFDTKAMELPWLHLYDGKLMNSKEVLAYEGLKPIQPEELEGKKL